LSQERIYLQNGLNGMVWRFDNESLTTHF